MARAFASHRSGCGLLRDPPHLTFDSLKQACIDPDGRAYVGREPPTGAMPSQVISDVQIFDAPWAATKVVSLNPGLVAIIGARGAGKTALADMIAAGCEAISEASWAADGDVSPSFLVRARPLIGEATVKLGWGGGDESSCCLDGRDANDGMAFPRARYLSQQFVEELCSSKGASEGLVREIERVIFEAHAAQGHDGAYSFEELRDQRTTRFRQARRLRTAATQCHRPRRQSWNRTENRWVLRTGRARTKSRGSDSSLGGRVARLP